MKPIRALLYHGEFYIVLPALCALIALAIQAYHYFYQTDQVDNPIEVGIASLNALQPALLLAAFVAYVQKKVIGYRAENCGGLLRDDVFDAAVYCALYVLIGKAAHIL